MARLTGATTHRAEIAAAIAAAAAEAEAQAEAEGAPVEWAQCEEAGCGKWRVLPAHESMDCIEGSDERSEFCYAMGAGALWKVSQDERAKGRRKHPGINRAFPEAAGA
jgi:hypothetical protein